MGEFVNIWGLGVVVGGTNHILNSGLGNAAATVSKSVAARPEWAAFKFSLPSPEPRAPCNVGASADQGSADKFVFGLGAILFLFTRHAAGDGAGRSLPPPSHASASVVRPPGHSLSIKKSLQPRSPLSITNRGYTCAAGGNRTSSSQKLEVGLPIAGRSIFSGDFLWGNVAFHSPNNHQKIFPKTFRLQAL